MAGDSSVGRGRMWLCTSSRRELTRYRRERTSYRRELTRYRRSVTSELVSYVAAVTG